MPETQTEPLQEFNTGVGFDEDVRGFTYNEQKEVEGRNIPDDVWHTVSIKSATRVQSEEEVKWDALKPYHRSLYSVTFNVAVEGRKFPLPFSTLVAAKPIQLVSPKTGASYYPTASRLGSNLARATKIEGSFQQVLDAALTLPLYAKFATSDKGFQNLERLSGKLPKGNSVETVA